MQVQKKLHEEASKFREHASSLEKEYVSALEKKYYLLYHSTANLLHAMSTSKNIIKADEELTVSTVRIRRPGHGSGAACMSFAGKLSLEVRFFRPPGPGSGRIAALRHKPVDNTVKWGTVIKSLPG